MSDLSPGAVMGIVVFVIVGAAVGIPVTTSVINDVTVLDQAINESHNLTGGVPTLFNLTHKPLAAGTLVLSTNTTSVITLDLNYTILSATLGMINITSFDVDNNGTYVNATYYYEPDGYISSGTTRTLVRFIPLFIAIGILTGLAMWVGGSTIQ